MFSVGAARIVNGALGVVAYQPAFFLGTSLNGVAMGTMVALGSAPAMTGALSWVVERRFPGLRWAVATLVATAGVVLLGGVFDVFFGKATSSVNLAGLLGSLGAGFSYAVYTLIFKRLIDDGWHPSSSAGTVFGLAAIFGVVLLSFTDTRWMATGPGITMALWLGLGTTTVAYLLFAEGLQKLSAPTVSTLTLAEPVTASVLGMVILGERLGPIGWWGISGIAAGIGILLLHPRRNAAAPETEPTEQVHA